MHIKFGSEFTLEKTIIDNLSLIKERGFPPLYANICNQFPLPSTYTV